MNPRFTLPMTMLALALPLQAIGIDFGITLSLDIGVAVLFVLLNLKYLHLTPRSNEDIFFAAFLVWALVSLFLSTLIYPELQGVEGSEALRYSFLRGPLHWIRLMFYFLLFITLRNYLASEESRLAHFLKIVVAVSAALAIYGVYQFFALTWDLPGGNFRNVRDPEVIPSRFLGSETDRINRIFAFSEEPTNYGSLILMFIPLVLGAYYYQRWRRRQHRTNVVKTRSIPSWAHAVVVGLLLLNLVLSLSRAAGILLAVGIVLAFLLRLISLRTLVSIGLLLVTLVLLVQQALGVSVPFHNYISQLAIWQYSDISTESYQSALWNAAHAILANPIGIGLGSEAAYAFLNWQDGQGAIPGNIGFWPYIGMGTGLIGLAVMGALVARLTLKLAFPGGVAYQWRKVSRSVALGLVMLSGHLLVVNDGIFPYFWIMLAVGSAVSYYGRVVSVRRETLVNAARNKVTGIASAANPG
jgi:hypothetical protein